MPEGERATAGGTVTGGRALLRSVQAVRRRDGPAEPRSPPMPQKRSQPANHRSGNAGPQRESRRPPMRETCRRANPCAGATRRPTASTN